MKIIQVNPYFMPHVGGSEWYCQQLSKYLVERGHEIHIITSRLDKNTPLKEGKDGFYIHRYPCGGIIWGINPATFIVHRLLKAEVDVIHAHSYVFFTSNQVALIKKLNGTPFLIHLHGGIDFSPPTYDFSSYLKHYVKRNFYDPTVGRWTVQTANAIASVSKNDIKLAKRLWGLYGKKMHWVPNAINLEEFKRDTSINHLQIVFIGRLEEWKGIRVFLEAAKFIIKERDDVDFLIVGDGSLRKYVQNYICNDHIKVLGQVPYSLIPKILSKAAILVLPSYLEGLPTVCLEAFATEVPVVASNVGGIPEVVIDGKTGYLFSPGRVQQCIENIFRLLEDERLRRRMGRHGRRLVEKFYTWQTVVEKVEKIYENIRR